jgi:hypothetical protein
VVPGERGRSGQVGDLVEVFAREFQAGPWSLAELPGWLDARVVHQPGEPSVLGAVIQLYGQLWVGLNERIVGTPLEWPVLAHECGHVLLGLESFEAGMAFCVDQWPRFCETDAWLAGARLCVDEGQLLALQDGSASIEEIAQLNHVSPLLVQVRLADASGDRAVRSEALWRWSTYLHDTLTSIQ